MLERATPMGLDGAVGVQTEASRVRYELGLPGEAALVGPSLVGVSLADLSVRINRPGEPPGFAGGLLSTLEPELRALDEGRGRGARTRLALRVIDSRGVGLVPEQTTATTTSGSCDLAAVLCCRGIRCRHCTEAAWPGTGD